jgi:Integrase core domain
LPTRSALIGPWTSSTGSSSNEPFPGHPLCQRPRTSPRTLCVTGTGTSYIEPGSPWQTPWVESYGSRVRDELLSIEQFDTLLEAQVFVADWREETTRTVPIRHSACSPLPSSPNDGGPKHRFSSRNGWAAHHSPSR